ncbi:hypothetical protein B0H13DRAFT_2365906 [Mycena leptocephala]|nr:hypothetical protein B0H13DRAFT_2365906 [Mycena leptocephala]
MSDWIGQQKTWATVPPRVRKAAAELFLVPQELELELLPSPYLPIVQMLDFSLPLQNQAVTVHQPRREWWDCSVWKDSDAEVESDAAVVLGRGRRRKIVVRQY